MISSLRRADTWSISHGTKFSFESSRWGVTLSSTRRYELSFDLNQSAPEQFRKDSTGRLLDADRWRVEHYWLDGGRSRWPSPGRFDWSAFSGINGGYLGATDWTVSHGISFPHWFAIVLLSLPMSIRTLLRWRRRSIDPARCAKCGYDLRATPLRCPECGMIAEILPV
jgi:hypothetical protein